MSRLTFARTALHRAIHSFKLIHTRANSESLNLNIKENTELNINDDNSSEGEIIMRGNSDTDDTDDSPPQMEAGRRGPEWYDWMSNLAQKNRERSIDNQKLLYRLDYRTVWIARLLTGILLTVIGGYILTLL